MQNRFWHTLTLNPFKSQPHTAFQLLAAFILATSFATQLHANLIINGGFEETTVNDGNGGWEWFTSDNVSGWEGSNIEIWHDFGNIGPYEGAQHAELNAHPNNGQPFSITQTFSTAIGESYDVFFAYGARHSNEEQFLFEIADISTIVSDHTVNNWSTYSNSFIATEGFTTIGFTSLLPTINTVGNFLDDIRVTLAQPTPSPSIPEPAGLLLFGLGLVGLKWSRKN